MKPNIWDRLLDSLSYYKSGSYTKRFSQCFGQVLASLNLDLGKELNSNLRARYFHAARVLGFLERNSFSITNDWSLNPPALLKTHDGYTLISPPNIATKYSELFKEFKDHTFPIYCENEDVNEYCQVTLKISETVSDELKLYFQEQGIFVIENFEENFITKLPPIEKVNEFCFRPSKGKLMEFFNEAEIFNFDEFKWMTSTPSDLFAPALFRKKPEFRKYEYSVQYFKGDDFIEADISDHEWAYLLGAWLQNKSLGTIYDENKSKFYIPLKIQLPTLIDRLLVSSSMTLPRGEKIKEKWMWAYENVSFQTINKIYSIYPSLI
jgi:hypothetical protein